MAINGTYNVTIETPMGAQNSMVTFKTEGTALKGNFQGRSGSQAFSGTVEGNNGKWSITVPSPMGGQIMLAFICQVTETELTGSVQLGQFGTAPVKGVKV